MKYPTNYMKKLNALLLTAKYPDNTSIGTIKTRLHDFLQGKEVMLYESFLKDSIRIAKLIPNCDTYILGFPGNRHHDFEKKYGILTIPSSEWNIMKTLQNGFIQTFANGYKKVIAFNTDSPDLPKNYLLEGFQQLEKADIVIGPSEDGGYYAIGMKENHEGLFDIEPSNGFVITQTRKYCSDKNLVTHLLPTWYDVDTEKDLINFARRLQEQPVTVAVSTRKLLHDKKIVIEKYNE